MAPCASGQPRGSMSMMSPWGCLHNDTPAPPRPTNGGRSTLTGVAADLLLLLGAGMFFVSLGVLALFAVSAVRHGWTAVRQRASRRRHLTLGAVSLAGAALLVGVPFAGVPIAEAQNDWFDPDGDGVLGEFVNGAYDWFDVNGGDWVRATGLMNTAAVGLTLLLYRLCRGARDRTA